MHEIVVVWKFTYKLQTISSPQTNSNSTIAKRRSSISTGMTFIKTMIIDGKERWESWINNKNDFYIQNDLDWSGSTCYIAIKECIN